MPFGSIIMRPGINAQVTPTLNVGGWSESQLVRFKDGLPQKYGGWQRMTDEPVVGAARGIHAWSDLNNYLYLAIGTHSRLQCFTTAGLFDITPLRPTDPTNNSAEDFSTTTGSDQVVIVDSNCTVVVNLGDWVQLVTAVSVGGLVLQGFLEVSDVTSTTTYTVTAPANATATVANGGAVAVYDTTITLDIVTVTLANHGFIPTDLYTNHVATTVGGITFPANGQFLVQTTPTADTFTIIGANVATSTATGSENGGNARFNYLIPTGYESSIAVSGWGSGTYGSGTYGTSTVSSGFSVLRQWALDNWGSYLVGNPNDGPIYVWIPSASYTPATVITGAPVINTQILVSNPSQIMVALGSETGAVQDRMLVRWCDVANYNDWVATAINQAGSYRIPNGSRIVGGLQTALQALIWTDVDLWSMQYIGQPFVFGFQQTGDNCGLISMRAACVTGNRILWMGQRGMFELGGQGVVPLKCDVWDFLFRNLDTQQFDKIFAAPNAMFSEVAWFFPSLGGDGEVDSYIKFNHVDGIWDYGMLVRTCWQNVSIWGPPIGIDENNYIQRHETTDDADGVAMVSSLKSGDIDLSEGEEFPFVDYLVLDGAKVTGTLNMTINSKEFPAAVQMSDGPFAITSTATDACPRLRGRQMNFEFESTEVGDFWRLGRVRYRYGVDGRR